MSPQSIENSYINTEELDTLLKDIFEFASTYYNNNHSAPIRPLLQTITSNRQQLQLKSSSLPSSSRPLRTTIEDILQKIVPSLVKQSNPHYYGFVTGGSTPASLLSDFIVTIIDQNVSVHLPRDAIHTQIERWAITMLCELYNLPPTTWIAGGTLTTGATSANILGLACGREFLLKNKQTGKSVSELGYLRAAVEGNVINGIKVITATPHSSIAKAASILGLGVGACMNLPLSKEQPWNFDIEALKRLLERAEEDQVRYIVVPGFAEVNTGRFTENIEEISRLCVEYGAWMHIDAAFGLFARCFESYNLHGGDGGGGGEEYLSQQEFKEIYSWTAGLELADSITGDCHKLLNVPYDCGLFLTRHADLLKSVCNNPGAAYLATPEAKTAADNDGNGGHGSQSHHDIEITSPCNMGIENSRRFRALPVYATLTTYGRQGYQKMTSRLIIHAREIALWISKSEDYELVMDDLDKVYVVVIFRARNEALNKRLTDAINDTGRMWVSGTNWNGKPATRIAVASWRVGIEADVRGTYSSSVVTSVLEELARSMN